MTKPEGFPRRLRLRQRREFLRVQRGGEKHHTRFFLVFVAPRGLARGDRGDAREGGSHGTADGVADGMADGMADSMDGGDGHAAGDASLLPATRLGVTVTRKVGKAVRRNRIKRLVREAFRREREVLPAGLDMVWVAKREAVDSTYEGVVADLHALAGRLRARPPKTWRGPSKRGRASR